MSAASTAPLSAPEVETLIGAGAVSALIDALDHPSWSVRRAIVTGLAGLGDAALPALCVALEAKRADETLVAASVDALVASSGDVETAIAPLAQHADAHVVADVAQILGRRRKARSVTLLIELTAHADDNVAVGAMEGLGRLNSRAAVDALLVCLQSAQFFRVFPAIDVLGRTGDPRVITPLAGLLRDGRYATEAARALGRTGDRAAVLPLSELLLSPHDRTVRVAALALVELHARHLELYGVAAAVEDALRKSAAESAVRRLGQALTAANSAEQVAICTLFGALHNPASVPFLQPLLEGAPDVAQAAALALRKLGRESDEPEFLAALTRADSAGRRVLLPLVSRLSASEAVSECLDDADAVVRAMACEALARIGNPAAVPALFRKFEDPNARVVQAAIGAVQSLGHVQTEQLALAAASASSASSRRAALRVLAYFGSPAALEVMREALANPNLRVREVAIQGLAYLEAPSAREALLKVARDAMPPVRAAAMRALGLCADDDTRVPLALRSALSDADAWVRYYAAQSLGKLRDEPSARALATMLHDPAGQVRVSALEALSHLRSELAMAALMTAAGSADVDMQRAALFGLSLAHHTPALALLRAACTSQDAATRLVALSATAAFDAPAVLEVLIAALRDPDEGVRTAALSFLGQRPEQRATDALVDRLRGTEPQQPLLAALAVASDGRVPGLVAALGDADDALAPLLTSCLSRLRSTAGTEGLWRALEQANPAARKAALATLIGIGAPNAHEAAVRLSSHDPDAGVRRTATTFLQ